MDVPAQSAHGPAAFEQEWLPSQSVSIEEHGIIGDMLTCALVGTDGSVDWYCYPHFDSPSIFAAILDPQRGGLYRIAPEDPHVVRRQFYWPETNVLITRFLSPDGVAELYDFMPLTSGAHSLRRLMRRISVVRGRVALRLYCRPAFDFGRESHVVVPMHHGAGFRSNHRAFHLATRVPLSVEGDAVCAHFSLEAGQSAVFTFAEGAPESCAPNAYPPEEGERLFRETVLFWRRWIKQCTYTGRWREVVHRSALVLKLLTFEPTGAIVAAPTTSLPETIGGGRNWDYRYTWLRDAAFTVYALIRIGFTHEAGRFMTWVEERFRELEPDGSLQLMYGIDGRHKLDEEILPLLRGHKDSFPVRIGNDAYKQLQLDIYGELMDAVYLYNKHGAPISYELWEYVRRLVNWTCDHWHLEDDGIWEVRGGRKHFVYSKMMCWVALDRAIRLAQKRSFPADRARWLHVRDLIYEDIQARGYSASRGAYVQAYGVESLDAANLIMPLVFFVSPVDPRMIDTLEAIRTRRAEGGLLSDSLVYRYDVDRSPDGLVGREGTFNLCTFWLVEALTRASVVHHHYLEEARLIFERMLGYANHLGLYAEQIGPSGEALGNFPQAFTHLSLISSAFNLDRALNARRSHGTP